MNKVYVVSSDVFMYPVYKKYVEVPVLNVCRTVIRIVNSSGTLSNEAWSIFF